MIEITTKLALAAGHDAASRNARKHGRTRWNLADYRIGANVARKLMAMPNAKAAQ